MPLPVDSADILFLTIIAVGGIAFVLFFNPPSQWLKKVADRTKPKQK